MNVVLSDYNSSCSKRLSLLNVMYCVCMMVRIICEARSNFWIAGQLQVHMVSYTFTTAQWI